MRKIFSFVILSLLVAGTMLAAPADLSAATCRLKIKLDAPGGVNYAKLYVDGRYKGYVYSSRYTTVRVESGRSHSVMAYRSKGGEYLSWSIIFSRSFWASC